MNSIIESLLIQNEGKTLEFKQDLSSPTKVIKTIVAFANTAGGKIIIGIEDRSKNVIGIQDVTTEEERLANLISDSISPQLVPNIYTTTWRNADIMVIEVHHDPKPYYIKSEGAQDGVYIRHGSTNRKASPEIIKGIHLLARNTSFDEQPCLAANSEAVDFRVASELFKAIGKPINEHKLKTLKLNVSYQGIEYPSNGYILLFGKSRFDHFPDALIRCARFKGLTRTKILDQADIDAHLPIAIDQAITFIERNTSEGIDIGRLTHNKKPEYPSKVIREAVINAVVHADYAIQGSTIQIAIYDNRVEITNPGELPFGLTLEDAISGISRLRNRVIGRVFKELKLIEQWGSGLGRMIQTCQEAGLKKPDFKEMSGSFRVTIFNEPKTVEVLRDWEKLIIGYLNEHGKITTKEAAIIWDISDRATRDRLRKLINRNKLAEIGKNPNDPKRYYVLLETI